MNPEDDTKYVRIKKATISIIVLIIVAGVIGWLVGRSNNSQPNNNQANNPPASNASQPAQPAANNASGADVKSLVNYTLPDGWKEASCPSQPGAVFIVPSGADDVDCDANPSSPVKISVDPANNKDCNQLQNVQNVSKHICISEFINGRKSLKAETVYSKDSSYQKDTAINAYYIDTGKGVVKVEYVHDPSGNQYQGSFEQLAKSVKTT